MAVASAIRFPDEPIFKNKYFLGDKYIGWSVTFKLQMLNIRYTGRTICLHIKTHEYYQVFLS